MNIFNESTFFAITLIFFLAGCRGSNTPHPDLEKGHDLARQHCVSCHQFPDADQLDKKTWLQSVLPKMGSFMGFRRLDGITYFPDGRPGTMPSDDWNKIIRYYVNSAPDSLPDQGNLLRPGKQLQGFSVMPFRTGIHKPATTFAGIFPGIKNRICITDGFNGEVYFGTVNGKLVDSLHVGTGASHVAIDSHAIYVLTMGVMHPSDGKFGKLLIKNNERDSLQVVLDSLQRPVFAEYQDINLDGRTDILLCEFGNYQGRLSWFEQDKNGKYIRHVLREAPGAVHTAIADLNGDRLPDIVALMAQGDEGIFIYYQQQDGSFREKRALRFPPTYGSNYFELADFNNDGHMDILATNGDNGDYPPILKPYHGIRIYVNDGHNAFTEKTFLPMHGAVKAVARDFDDDGDLDVASIAYFPDYRRHPEESFLYWENAGNGNFRSYSCQEAGCGRWLTMDAGDLNADGKTDIILGNANLPLGQVPPAQLNKWASDPVTVLMMINEHQATSGPKMN